MVVTLSPACYADRFSPVAIVVLFTLFAKCPRPRDADGLIRQTVCAYDSL